MQETEIDIVLPWVDHTDEQWRLDFAQNLPTADDGDTSQIRFRDWGLLPYWFRGIEKSAPWVRKIHFITSGHVPEWLNTNHPKLNWVRHSDYIPEEYLPTFNANTIELNIHRIEGLARQFIYFNDDAFVLRPILSSRFFRQGLPCDYGVMTAKPSSGGIIHMAINDLEVIETCFDKHRQMWKYPFKWFNFKYGKGLLNNLLLYPWREFSGFIDPHQPNAFLKSTFEEVWEKVPIVLDATCRRKFRSEKDVNQWLMRYWQMVSGEFYPSNTLKRSLNLDINDSTLMCIGQYVSQQRYELLCFNDSEMLSDFEKAKALLKESFEHIFPEPSGFEKK